jgi:hypothetical protein
MICPNCKCEYIRGVTECADCGVALVEALEPTKNSARDIRIVSVWQGDDPSEYERVKASLKEAGIESIDRDSKNFNPFIPLGSNMEIWVSAADREAARKIILDEDGRIDPEDLTPEGIEALTLPESDAPEDPEDDDLSDLSVEWHEDDPAVAVWTGDSEALADNLTACLREVGIASRKHSEAAQWILLVRPEKESRAKEIVREVVDASPPV